MSTLELISTERDLLTAHNDSFNAKQADIQVKYDAVIDRLASSIAGENEETAALAQLQKQLDEISLIVMLEKYKDMKGELDAKFQSYSAVVQSNNSLAASIFQNTKNTKDLVSEIMTIIGDLDTNISNINVTIDTMTAPAIQTPTIEETASDA